jgi:hypothetical protein
VRLYVTIDRLTIVDWARASPSTFEGDEHPWPLLFEFGPSLPPDVIAISWDRFFAQFERDELALAFFDVAPDGKLDDYHQFVKRTDRLIGLRPARLNRARLRGALHLGGFGPPGEVAGEARKACAGAP